ncbi:MAG: proline dehydrogenase family protein [Ignavibacteriae bacterium]|nr:proline dehydrogenase family protein [Ignavibacteriota bacterium]
MLNQIIVKMMPVVPKGIIHQVAKKYIAGDELSDAVRVSKELLSNGGAMTTVDVLGEFVTTKERAFHEKAESLKVLEAIKANNLSTYLSVKPTSLGLGIDENFGFDNISYIIKKAAETDIFVRLDMENSPYTTKTLNLFKKLRAEGLNNVGVVIQAYLHRSENDIKELLQYKPSIRLCKGIYRESPEIAFQTREDVRNNYKKLLRLIIDNGLYIGIATHDDPLINDAREYINKINLKKEDYEFQMLLGVRDEKRKEILSQGHRLRVYVPFGKDWYGYSTRRLKENPKMAGMIFKAIFFKN